MLRQFSMATMIHWNGYIQTIGMLFMGIRNYTLDLHLGCNSIGGRKMMGWSGAFSVIMREVEDMTVRK